jgi:hypothetical protein
MVKKVAAMLGPLIVMFCVEVIPYTIMALYWMTQDDFYWFDMVEVPLKLGYIFIACSASSKVCHIFSLCIQVL